MPWGSPSGVHAHQGHLQLGVGQLPMPEISDGLPPEGSDMYIRPMNQRLRRGYGTEKVSKKRTNEDGEPMDDEYEWINAPPRPRVTEYGDPPVPEAGKKYDHYFQEQTTELSKQRTANMLYKMAYAT